MISVEEKTWMPLFLSAVGLVIRYLLDALLRKKEWEEPDVLP